MKNSFNYPKINKSISYDENFIYDDVKYEIKLNIGLNKDETNEGIWALIHPNDYDDYCNDSIKDLEYNRVAFLLNRSVYGIEWGSPIPYKLNGEDRPISILTDYLDKPSDISDELTEYLKEIDNEDNKSSKK